MYPSAEEVCDGLVNPCGSTLSSTEVDDDGDGYVECDLILSNWQGAEGILGGNDCDDTDQTIYDNAIEVCDGQDNDCDEEIPAGEEDKDADGYVSCNLDPNGWDGPTLVDGGNDCDDDDPNRYPRVQKSFAMESSMLVWTCSQNKSGI